MKSLVKQKPSEHMFHTGSNIETRIRTKGVTLLLFKANCVDKVNYQPFSSPFQMKSFPREPFQVLLLLVSVSACCGMAVDLREIFRHKKQLYPIKRGIGKY